MAAKQFPSKDPRENVILTFDFSPSLATGVTLSSIYAYSVLVIFGTDSAPTTIWNGSPAIDGTGTKVLVPVTLGNHLADYLISVTTQTSDPLTRLTLSGILPVRSR